MARQRQDQEGFTLVEMSVVVAIIGILAVLATVGYRKLVTSSYVTEGTRMVNAIRIAQETVKAETGSYLSLGMTLCPAGAGTGGARYVWDPACSSGTGSWSLLPVTTDGPVRFGYGTVANTALGQAIAVPGAWNGTVNGTAVVWPATAPQNWYVIVGRADLDGDATTFTTVIGSSLTNEVWIDNDGR